MSYGTRKPRHDDYKACYNCPHSKREHRIKKPRKCNICSCQRFCANKLMAGKLGNTLPESKCFHCGIAYDSKGVYTHERQCSLNPEVQLKQELRENELDEKNGFTQPSLKPVSCGICGNDADRKRMEKLYHRGKGVYSRNAGRGSEGLVLVCETCFNELQWRNKLLETTP